jgi:hypothetical protein
MNVNRARLWQEGRRRAMEKQEAENDREAERVSNMTEAELEAYLLELCGSPQAVEAWKRQCADMWQRIFQKHGLRKN